MKLQWWGTFVLCAVAFACSPAPAPVGSIDGKVEVKDGTTDGVFVSIGSDVKGVAADGTFSFPGLTPAPYTVTATKDGWVSATAQATVTKDQAAHVTLTLEPKVKPNQPPVLSSFSVNPTSIARGGEAKVLAVASDPDGDALTYTFAAGAGWTVTPGETAGTATLTAPQDANLSTELTVTVKDAHDATVSGKLLIGTSQDRAPVVASIVATSPILAPKGSTSIAVEASDPDGEALTYAWHVPEGWNLEGSGATVTVTAPDAYDQKAIVSVDVKDPAGATLTAAVGLSTPRNQAPIFASLTATPTPVVPGGAVTLTASATDPEGEAITFAWTAPEGWTLDGSGPQVTLTAPDFHGKQGLVQVTATDAHGKATNAQLAVATTPNAPPMLSSLVATPPSLKPGETAQVQAIAFDPDGETLSYTWHAPQGWAISGTGSEVTVTAPNAFAQTARVSVEVNDGNGGTLTGALLLSTIAEGAPIVSSVTAAPALVNPGGTLHVAASAQDANGSSLTYEWTAPTGWTVTPEGNGSTATVTAPGSYAQVATLTVAVSNGSKTTSASVVVGTALNHAPVVASLLANPNPLLPKGTAEVMASASDPDGDQLTYTWTAPNGWSIAGTGAKVTLTAPDARGTTAVLRLDVADASGLSTTAQLLVATTENRPPQLTGLTVTGSPAEPSGTVQLHATASDPDGDALVYDWAIPAGWTLSGSGADVTLTAPARTDVTASVFVAVSDPLGVAASGRIQVKTRANIAPTFAKLDVTPNPAHALASVTATATATDPDPQTLAYTWEVTGGWTVVGSGATVTLKAPATRGTTATLKATVDDGFGGTATKTATLNTEANALPTVAFVTASKLDLVPGATLPLAVEATDGDGDPLTYTWSAPAGWTITGTGANVVLHVTGAYAATGTIHVDVDDGFGGTAGTDLALGTRANTPPTISSLTATPATAKAGATLQLEASATDPDAQTLTYAWEATSGWTISGTGAKVSLAAPNQRGATGTVTLTVTDGAGGSDTKTVSVATETNHAPVAVFTTQPQTALARRAQVTLDLVATDADGDALGFAWTAPTGFTIDGTGASVTLTAPDAYDQAGQVTVVVTDTFGANVTVTLDVATHANTVPTIDELTATPATVAAGGSIALAAKTTEKDGDTLTYTWTVPGGWKLTGTGANVTLEAPMRRNESGTVTLEIDDGFGGTAQKTVSVGTTNNQNPTIADLTATPPVVAAAGTIALEAQASDPDGDALDYEWTVPAGWTLVGSGAVVALEAPASRGQTGTVTITVDDGFGGTAQQAVTVATVANHSPFAMLSAPASTGLVPGSAITVTVLATDSDGDALTYQWQATGGFTVAASNDTAVITAPQQFDASGTVTVAVEDGFGGTMTLTLALTTRPNALPVISSLDATPAIVTPGGMVTLTAVAADPDGSALTYDWTVPAGWTVVGSGATVQVAAPTQRDQSARVKLVVSDGFGGSASQTVDIATSTNHAPTVTLSNDPTTNLEPLATAAVKAIGSDLDLDTLSYVWSATGGFQVTGSGADVIVAAPADFDASGNLHLEVTDGFGGVATADLALSTRSNAAPVIANLTQNGSPAAPGGVILVDAVASDSDGQALTYVWSIDSTWSIDGTGASITVTAPNTRDTSTLLSLEVRDGFGGRAVKTITLATQKNNPPEIGSVVASPTQVARRGTIDLGATATDADNDTLTYTWSAPTGWTLAATTGDTVQLTAPNASDLTANITVTVTDGFGGSATGHVTVSTDPDQVPEFTVAPPTLAATAGRATVKTSVHATDADGDKVTYSLAAGAPAGATVDADGTFSWLPRRDQAGSHTMTVIAGDGALAATLVVTVNVAPFDLTSSATSAFLAAKDAFAGDANGDGAADLVFVDGGADVQLAAGNGDGTFASSTTLATATGGQLVALAIADVDGDQNQDAIVADAAGALHVFFPALASAPMVDVSTLLTGSVTGLAVLDIDGDGDLDVAMSGTDADGTGGLDVFTNDGSGAFTARSTLVAVTCPGKLVAADFDQDGFEDLAIAHTCDATVEVLPGAASGTGTAYTLQLDAADACAKALTTGDFDQDGRVDLAIVPECTGHVVVSANSAAAGLELAPASQQTVTSVASGQRAVLATDVDGDGSLDLAIADGRSGSGAHGSFELLFGTATGTFGAPTTFGSGANEAGAGVVAGDFDGDGASDVAWFSTEEVASFQ